MTVMIIFSVLVVVFIFIAGVRSFFNKDNETTYSVTAMCLVVAIISAIILTGNSYKVHVFKAEVESFAVDYQRIKEIHIKADNSYLLTNYHGDIIGINKRIAREKQHSTAIWIIRDFVDLKTIATLKPIEF